MTRVLRSPRRPTLYRHRLGAATLVWGSSTRRDRTLATVSLRALLGYGAVARAIRWALASTISAKFSVNWAQRRALSKRASASSYPPGRR
jgi:hypothetical protein